MFEVSEKNGPFIGVLAPFGSKNEKRGSETEPKI